MEELRVRVRAGVGRLGSEVTLGRWSVETVAHHVNKSPPEASANGGDLPGVRVPGVQVERIGGRAGLLIDEAAVADSAVSISVCMSIAVISTARSTPPRPSEE